MAFPDGYTEWGGTAADFTTSSYQVKDGVAVVRAQKSTVRVYDAAEGGDQVTDLYNHDQAPVTELISATSGFLETFWAPDTYDQLWISVAGGQRVQLVRPAGLGQDWAAIHGKPVAFPPSPHSHTQGDIVGLTAAIGAVQEEDGTPVPGYQYRVIVDPADPTEIQDIIIEAI